MQRDVTDPDFKPVLEKPEKRAATSQADIIDEKIKHEEMKLERIKAAYEDGIDTLEEYKANKTKITAAIAALNEKLQTELGKNKKSGNSVDYDAFRHKLASVVEIISAPDVTPESFNEALLSVVKKIVFDRQKTHIDIFYK